jgi:hypothetical protein
MNLLGRSGKSFLLLILLCTVCMPGNAQSKDTATQSGLDTLLKQFRLEEVEARLRKMKASPERDYIAGMLANRENNTAKSIQLLVKALPAMRASRPDRAALALEALADDYRKNFLYGEALRIEDDLMTQFSGQLKPDDLQGLKDDKGILKILRDAPAQTITRTGAIRLKTERNPLMSMNVTLTVNGVQGPWLLDTGANLSVVSTTFAKRLGLKPLEGRAQGQAGLTGIENTIQVALVPALTMEGAALHNVVVVIMDDASLNVGPEGRKYQINGIIGYPVFQALGTIRFLHDGFFEAGGDISSTGAGARMYMDDLSPVIACSVEGHRLPFYIDTGAKRTNLFVPYYERFHDEAGKWKKAQTSLAGAGGTVSKETYIQPELVLGVGDKEAMLHDVTIYASETKPGADELYGNLGQDLVERFDGFALDFTSMRFSLGNPLPATVRVTAP